MRTKQILLAIAMLSCVAVQAQITLGSRRAVCDSLTGDWLCCVPQSTFGQDFETTLNLPATWADITIDGDTVMAGTSYTFKQVSGERKYALVAHQADSVTISGNICFTFYPILELTGTFTDDYQITDVIANLPANQGPTTMFAKVKHRGGSTNTPDRLKRNYHIKFLNADSTKMDRKFFGLRNDNSWLLDAGQIDMLRIRNRVATELWADMGTRPYYADREPKAMNYVRGDFVEMFLNGKYNGIYALTEAMDRKQLRLAKYDETDSVAPFHGMLWKTKAVDPVSRMFGATAYDNNSSMWGGVEVKYPDPDDVMPTDYKTLYDATDFVANGSNDDFRAHVGEYFDIPVMMDYYIFTNTVLAIDNGTKNIYWGVYDQQVDKKITLAAWDLDCTFGQNWINNPLHNEDAVGPTHPMGLNNRLLIRLHELNPDSFAVKAVERFRMLRQTIFSNDSLKRRFAQRLQPLFASGAIAREQQRWTNTSDLSNNPLDFEAEMAYIEDWIDRRMPYLDNKFFRPYIKGDSNRDGVIDITDINRLISMMLIGDYPFWYEDMNDDDVVDISDINAIINVLLGKNQ